MIQAGGSAGLRETLIRELQPPTIPAGERAVLRACLLPLPAAAIAWQACPGHPAALAANGETPPSLRALLPLLAERLPLFGLATPLVLASQLRAARAIELRRNETLRQIAGAVMANPVIAGHQPLLLGGLATASRAWPDPMLRHTSRLALLLASPQAARQAAEALQKARLVEASGTARWIGSAMRLRHASGMPVLLHGGSCAAPVHGLSYNKLMTEAVPGTIEGTGVLFSGPATCFVLAAIEAVRGSPGTSFLWLADAVFLLRAAGAAIAASEIVGRRFPLALMAASLARCAAGIEPSIAADPAMADLMKPGWPDRSSADLISALAAVRGPRAAFAAIPRPRARLFWLLRLAPSLMVARLRDRRTLASLTS